MEQVKVTVPREAPPDWARPTEASAPDPDRWTDRQKAFALSLIAERDTSKQSAEVQIWLGELVKGERALTKRAASELIDKLLKFPKRVETQMTDEQGRIPMYVERFAIGVPAGRYAVENNEGELRFYKVWVSRDKKRLNVYVEYGPNEADLQYQQTVLAILSKIKIAGIRECAIRYGMEIGHCSNCGYRLTNRISRELGIGPVCGGRMFGDDFKTEVKAKKKEIRARGEDPNEKLDD